MAENERTAERARLDAAAEGVPWRKWGPYLSERQWGTVREDYSPGGTAWDYFSHDQARSRAYRWGEDGIGGWSDDHQRLCLSVALWNGQDPILKERLFGLTNSEGNHGEDVKELYYYDDGTPTHSYMRMLYKYPQRAYPYSWLVDENRRRSKEEREFELIDTGIFDDDRYFDVVIEWAKASPEETLLVVTAHNRGPDAAPLWLIPQFWFRNTWSWGAGSEKPSLRLTGARSVAADDPGLGNYVVDIEDDDSPIAFCENVTNAPRLFGVGGTGPFKDAFHELVVHGNEAAVRRDGGTKAAAIAHRTIPAGGTASIRLTLRPAAAAPRAESFEAVVAKRRAEADEFYAQLQDRIGSEDEKRVQRQALAGMLWSKQYFYYDVRRWLEGDPAGPPPPSQRRSGRNAGWKHFDAAHVMSMPDTWEYPWFAAWDLAFHCITFALVDPAFAKQQLALLTRDWFIHASGQLPAYEWAFGDVNPPVHAWAAWRVFQADRRQRGDSGDLRWLEQVFIKLLLNFTWWVNRKDVEGNNLFEGGFLGLDNIGVFDRSAPLPTGGFIEQSDGTSWMAMYSLNMLRISMQLALHDDVYEDIATKFFEHFLHIVEAMTASGGGGLWNDDDQFFYDVLTLPDRRIAMRVRSMVGLIPLYAVEVLEEELLSKLPKLAARLDWFVAHRPELAALVSTYSSTNQQSRRLLSMIEADRLRPILTRLLDEAEFLSPYGIRALSRAHLDAPFRFDWEGNRYEVRYTPAESNTGLFGGNSNWRGPIWMPVNYLIVESLHKFHHFYGDDFKIDFPTGSGRQLNLLEVADEISKRLVGLFARDASGRRPVYGQSPKEQNDPHFRDLLSYYEYFDGDTGRGVGASHQTGWTGLVAKLIQPADVQGADHIANSGERD